MSKKILVSGGAGFIGSEFVREGIKRGYRIILVDKLTYAGDIKRIEEVFSNLTFYKADIRNYEFMNHIFSLEKPEYVVHMAAESHVDRSILDSSPFIETNIRGTQVLLDLAKLYNIERFINISTDEVYGDLGKDGKFYEDSPLRPNSPYSVTKAAADMLARAYQRTFGLPVITVRPSNNYGPWQYPEKLIPVVILKAIENEKIPVYGKGENVREWLYVSDCVDAIFKILEKGSVGEIYNVGSGQEKRNIEVVEAILEILKKPKELISFVKDRPGHDFRYSLDTQKIKKELGWYPKTDFEKGIDRTVKWYLENIGWTKEKLSQLKSLWKKVYK